MDDQGENKLQYYEGHDPLQKARLEQQDLNTLWLSAGEKQTSLQRVGFCIMSFVLLMGAIMWLQACVVTLQDVDGSLFFAVGFGILTLVSLYLALAGFRNAFRTKTK